MILRQFNVLGQMRWDAPFFRLLESSAAGDFDVLSGTILAGRYPLVVKGFELITNNAIGAPATSLQIIVANSIIQNYNASESGSLYAVPSTRSIEILSTINSRIIGSFTSNATNYIGIDLRRTADPSTSDLVQFISANTDTEIPNVVPLGRTLDYVIVISTQDFSATPTLAPIAKVITDVNNNVVSLTDARSFFFRLGSGGSIPNARFAYPWPSGRTEVGDNSDFNVGDKAILSLKDWCNAVMTRTWEIGGGTYWYSPTADRNVQMIRVGSTFSNGEWFSWDGTNLLWQGLSFLFDNSSPAVFNDIKNQTVPSPGLTDLLNGECIYVDIDRTITRTRTGLTALQPVKTSWMLLGTPTVPGSRYVIAWRFGNTIATRDSSFPVGATFSVATTTSLGIVQLSGTAGTPLTPIVASLDASNQAQAAGLTRGNILGVGPLSIGQQTNDTNIGIGKSGFNTTLNTRTITIGDSVASSNVPMSIWQDNAGHLRTVLDHNGYIMGRSSEFREEWFGPTFFFGSSGAHPSTVMNGRWIFDSSLGASISGSSLIDGTLGARAVYILMSDQFGTAGQTNDLATVNSLVILNDNADAVLEWESKIDASSLAFTNAEYRVGLTTVGSPFSAAYPSIYFARGNTGNWLFGHNGLETNTGVAPSGNWQRMRIEFHGANTFIGIANGGTFIKFFIDEVNVGNSSMVTSASPLFFDINIKITFITGILGQLYYLYNGPIYMKWNRFLSLPAL